KRRQLGGIERGEDFPDDVLVVLDGRDVLQQRLARGQQVERVDGTAGGSEGAGAQQHGRRGVGRVESGRARQRAQDRLDSIVLTFLEIAASQQNLATSSQRRRQRFGLELFEQGARGGRLAEVDESLDRVEDVHRALLAARLAGKGDIVPRRRRRARLGKRRGGRRRFVCPGRLDHLRSGGLLSRRRLDGAGGKAGGRRGHHDESPQAGNRRGIVHGAEYTRRPRLVGVAARSGRQPSRRIEARTRKRGSR